MLSSETLNVTNFSDSKIGEYVNLERALKMSERLGGHIVSGHIDCIGKLISINQLSNFYNLEFKIPQNSAKYVIYKGSITINGISLTVSQINDNIFKVAIIPHTYQNTVLKYLKIAYENGGAIKIDGDSVNIETDILAKYVEKLIGFGDNRTKETISMKFLEENGFV